MEEGDDFNEKQRKSERKVTRRIHSRNGSHGKESPKIYELKNSSLTLHHTRKKQQPSHIISEPAIKKGPYLEDSQSSIKVFNLIASPHGSDIPKIDDRTKDSPSKSLSLPATLSLSSSEVSSLLELQMNAQNTHSQKKERRRKFSRSESFQLVPTSYINRFRSSLERNWRIIFSFDGGGIRGLISAYILSEIERVAFSSTNSKNKEKDLSKEFNPLGIDLSTGTSVGSIIASGVSIGMRAEDILKNMIEGGPVIFSNQQENGWISRLFYASKFNETGLKKLLKKTFGNKTLKEVDIPLLITAHDLSSGTPGDFNSEEAKTNPSRNYKIREATAASAAAAPILPYAFATNEKGVKRLFADGGISGVNNPVMEAVRESLNRYPNDRIFLLSIGTGSLPARKYEDVLKEKGSIEALMADIQSGFNALPVRADHQARDIVRALGGSYFRLNPILQKGEESMDNTSEKNLQSLNRIAQSFIDKKSEKIQKIVQEIQKINREKEKQNKFKISERRPSLDSDSSSPSTPREFYSADYLLTPEDSPRSEKSDASDKEF